MPDAFKASPDHPAVAYLVRLHADLDDRIQANKAEAAKLAADMQAVRPQQPNLFEGLILFAVFRRLMPAFFRDLLAQAFAFFRDQRSGLR